MFFLGGGGCRILIRFFLSGSGQKVLFILQCRKDFAYNTKLFQCVIKLGIWQPTYWRNHITQLNHFNIPLPYYIQVTIILLPYYRLVSFFCPIIRYYHSSALLQVTIIPLPYYRLPSFLGPNLQVTIIPLHYSRLLSSEL